VLYEQYLARWLDNSKVGKPEVFIDQRKCAFAETLNAAFWRTGATSLGWRTGAISLGWQALQDTVRWSRATPSYPASDARSGPTTSVTRRRTLSTQPLAIVARSAGHQVGAGDHYHLAAGGRDPIEGLQRAVDSFL
jgi:hypothetical protein